VNHAFPRTNPGLPHPPVASLAQRPAWLPRFCLVLGLLGTVSLRVLQAGDQTRSTAPPPVSYAREIQPLLARRCFPCHGPDAAHREADLRLDQFTAATARRTAGPAIQPGDPDGSLVWQRITSHDDSLRMPPPGEGVPLRAAEVELLRRWIAEGAPYATHWLFRELRRPGIPVGPGYPANPIDAFVQFEWERRGLHPAPRADLRTLNRRLSTDVRGLPASVAEVDTCLDESSPFPATPLPHSFSATPESPDAEFAWQRLVDRVLADPAWGERLATFWFDLVRYADTVGYHGDQEHASNPYRQYVIRAFQANLPFDQFTREQLAGDLLPAATRNQQVATGYLRILQTSHEGGVQKAEYQKKYDADRVRNFGQVWLGLTTGCAECHDHKYDPLSQRDFYALEAFFADLDDTASFQGGDTNPTRREPEIRVPTGADSQLATDLEAGLQAPTSGAVSELESLTRRLDEVLARGERAMVARSTTPRETRVLPRGDWMDHSGEVVEPGVPLAVAAWQPPSGRPSRLDLANWLTGPARGVVARVLVNRLWGLFFGQGLSVTLEDNGLQGDPPSHPELLDWLAEELIASGWDLTHVARVILRSETYRLSAGTQLIPSASSTTTNSPSTTTQNPVESGHEDREVSGSGADPENRWLTRQGRWRLPAEAIRDLALAHSGLLVREEDGNSARPWQPAGYYVQLNFPRREYQPDRGAGQYRRAVYMHWQRQYLHPMLRGFDAPMREECTARRETSNTPQSALVLLNDPTFVEAARHLAARVLTAGLDPADQSATTVGERAGGEPSAGELAPADRSRLNWLARELLQRDWSARELTVLATHLAAARHEFRDATRADKLLAVGWRERSPTPRDRELPPGEWGAWTSLCRVILNSGEVLTRD